jgi:hypothetical protein
MKAYITFRSQISGYCASHASTTLDSLGPAGG